jgi:hypothetical protein
VSEATFAAGVTYLERYRLSVIPLRADDKRPAIEWKPYQDRRPSLEDLEAWFREGEANVGIVTGALSGIVVVDLDGPDGEQSARALTLPRTPIVQTPRGRHFYFRHPGGHVPNAAGVRPGVDVRGDGGYVVAPPSRVNGIAYAYAPACSLEDVVLAPAPSWLTSIRGAPRPTTAEPVADVIPSGQRNDTLASLAGTMRRRGLSGGAIAAALLEENASRCQPPLPAEEVHRIAESVSHYAPGPPRPTEPKASQLGYMNVLELLELVERSDPSYLVDGLWPADAYGVIGAQDKAGKSWAAADLAVSVATGTPWLGRFACESGAVHLLWGEGGAINLYRRLDAVCRGRGVVLADLFGDDVVRLALRVPRLMRPDHLRAVAEELSRHPAHVTILDPGYLAVAGAKSADLAGMGDVLGSIQEVCQDAASALVVSWHWNQSGQGTGAERFTGAGPSAWGRVLGSAAVEQRFTDDDGASVVTLGWEFTGGEIPDTAFRMTRRVWAEDPHARLSPIHYEVTVAETEPPAMGDGLTLTQRRVLAALGAATEGDPRTVREIGDEIAHDGRGMPLKTRTIQKALHVLSDEGLADGSEGEGVTDPGRWWRT